MRPYPAWKGNILVLGTLILGYFAGYLFEVAPRTPVFFKHLGSSLGAGFIGYVIVALFLVPRHKARERVRIRGEYTPEVAEALIQRQISLPLATLVEEEKMELQVAMQAHHEGWTEFLVRAFVEDKMELQIATLAHQQGWIEFLVRAFVEDVWDLNTCTAVATGQPILGMEDAAVLLMWGQPDTNKQEVLKTKTKEVWTWYSSRDNRKIVGRRATMENGALVGWEIA